MAAILCAGLALAGCSVSLPMFATREPEPVVLTTGAIVTPARPQGPSLSDHLGPEDLRRAAGAMALALDPQGNGAAVNWDNSESRSSGRFTPVGGPFLRDDEVCRAFLASIATTMDRHALQGMACRPSGGEWSVRDLKPWKAQG